MLALILSLALSGDPSVHDVVAPKIRDVVAPSDPARVMLAGPLATRFALVTADRLRSIDEDALLAGFEHRPGAQAWVGEHVGKWLHAATLCAAATRDEALQAKIDRVKQRLLATQEEDGYLGTYLPAQRFGLDEGADWDVWVHKYVLIGLLSDWRYRDSIDALMSARRAGDVLCSTFGAGGKDLVAAGTHVGMAATSVLEPMVLLYRCTDEVRYREFCERLIERMAAPGGPNLLNDLLANRPLAEVANGKAYEMLSNLVGFCEFYRQFGDPRFKAAVEQAWNDILATQLYPTGSASTGEFWQRSGEYACNGEAHLGETCVTVTWLQLNVQLYRLTGDAKYLEEIERTTYNHLLAAQHGSGSDWCYFTPLAGQKEFRGDINCCHSSGPRGLALLPTLAVTQTGDSIRVNLYDFARADFEIKGNKVTLERGGDPWSKAGCTIRVTASMPGVFEVALRRPSYASGFECQVGDEVLAPAAPGFVAVRRDFGKASEPAIITVRGLAEITTIDASAYGRADQVVLRYGPFVLAPDPNFTLPGGIATRPSQLETFLDPKHGESWRVVVTADDASKRLELLTFASGRRARGAGMQDRSDRDPAIAERFAGTLRRELADAEHALRRERVDEAAECIVAGREQRALLVARQLVGREVRATLGHEHQRTIVPHEEAGEELVRRGKALARETPEPLSAHFAARARKALDRALGMERLRDVDRFLDTQPIANCRDLAEWHAGLRHAEWAGIHAEPERFDAGSGVGREILLDGAPRVHQRVVDHGDR